MDQRVTQGESRDDRRVRGPQLDCSYFRPGEFDVANSKDLLTTGA
jgi:hypothetical protein